MMYAHEPCVQGPGAKQRNKGAPILVPFLPSSTLNSYLLVVACFQYMFQLQIILSSSFLGLECLEIYDRWWLETMVHDIQPASSD